MRKQFMMLAISASVVIQCQGNVLDLSLRHFLSQAAAPNVKVLGSTCAILPALIATALIQKVSNLLAKHGTANQANQQAASIARQLAKQIKLDRQYTARLIKGNHSQTLKKKETQVLKTMSRLAEKTSDLAVSTLRFTETKQVKHLDWYQQDLSVAKLMAHSASIAIRHYQ